MRLRKLPKTTGIGRTERVRTRVGNPLVVKEVSLVEVLALGEPWHLHALALDPLEHVVEHGVLDQLSLAVVVVPEQHVADLGLVKRQREAVGLARNRRLLGAVVHVEGDIAELGVVLHQVALDDALEPGLLHSDVEQEAHGNDEAEAEGPEYQLVGHGHSFRKGSSGQTSGHPCCHLTVTSIL